MRHPSTDVSANQVAAYVTGLVRGATKSLVIDIGALQPWQNRQGGRKGGRKVDAFGLE